MRGKSRLLIHLVATAVVLTAGSVTQAQQTSLKIGVFDPQRVAEESLQGQRLQARLMELQQTKQTELASKGQELAELEKRAAEQALSLSTERRNALQMDVERRKLELENLRSMATQQLQLEFSGAQSEFNEMLIRGVQEFGQNEGFDLILDVAAVAWAGPTVDVTTAIIDRFDEMFPAAAAGGAGGTP